MMRSLSLFLIACAFPAPLLAQPAGPPPAETQIKEPFMKAVAEEAIRALASKLETSFVLPDKGRDYAAMLRANLAAGKYAQFADASAFAEAVTEDLQALHKDGHLQVRVVPPEFKGGPGAEPRGGPGPRHGPPANAISNSGWIGDKTAYIRFEGFPGSPETMAALTTFLDRHKSARTVIIDARTHRGGAIAEMDLMFAQMFAKPTVLVTMDTRLAAEERQGAPFEAKSLRKVAGPLGVVRREHFVTPAAKPSLARAKVILLTSGRTASAGEHLSLALKRTKRATLIGETTRGANHFGGIEPLDEKFTYAAFIPVGRTFDPDTGADWEGTGVKPDIEVPADKALDEALKLAGVKQSAEAALASLK